MHICHLSLQETLINGLADGGDKWLNLDVQGELSQRQHASVKSIIRHLSVADAWHGLY